MKNIRNLHNKFVMGNNKKLRVGGMFLKQHSEPFGIEIIQWSVNFI